MVMVKVILTALVVIAYIRMKIKLAVCLGWGMTSESFLRLQTWVYDYVGGDGNGNSDGTSGGCVHNDEDVTGSVSRMGDDL